MSEQVDLLFAAMEQLGTPAFLAKDGAVIRCNGICAQLSVAAGTTLRALSDGEYPVGSAVKNLPIAAGGRQWSATVMPTEAGDVFLLQPDDDDEAVLPYIATAAARGLMPAVQALQSAGAELFPAIEELENDEFQRQTAELTRAFFRLYRSVLLLTDFDRMRTEDDKYQRRTDVFLLLRELLTAAEDGLRDCNVRLSWTVPQGSAYGAVNAAELQRAVLSLLSNAAKFAGDSRTVTVTVKAAQKRLTVAVRNDTVMAPEAMAGAFRLYGQDKLPEDDRTGAGLGLPVAQRIARRHGGSLVLESSDAVGTVATLLIRLDLPEGDIAAPTADLYGGYDPMLVEFSCILPSDTYDSRNVDL